MFIYEPCLSLTKTLQTRSTLVLLFWPRVHNFIVTTVKLYISTKENKTENRICPVLNTCRSQGTSYSYFWVCDLLLNAPWSAPTHFSVQTDEDATVRTNTDRKSVLTTAHYSARFGSVDKHRNIKWVWCQTESFSSPTLMIYDAVQTGSRFTFGFIELYISGSERVSGSVVYSWLFSTNSHM